LPTNYDDARGDARPVQLREKPEIPLPARGEPPASRHPAAPSSVAGREPRRATHSWLLVGAGALGIIAMITVALVLAIRGRGDVTPIPTTGASDAAGKPAGPALPCTLVGSVKKLAPAIYHAIPPYVSAEPDGARAVVGFTASEHEAMGVAIDLETLATERKLTESSKEPISGVVPLTAAGKLSFSVDRESGGLRYSRTIDAKPPITIGIADDGFASIVGGGVPRTAWPGGERAASPNRARRGSSRRATRSRSVVAVRLVRSSSAGSPQTVLGRPISRRSRPAAS
jgi:hypothetical protein